jgi:nucleoside-diphosphate-sugar epimerase
MTSDGTPWRPLVHIADIARAIQCALAAPVEAVRNQVYNVGATDANYQIREIAETVADVFPNCTLEFGPPGGDNRSYRVSFDKIHAELPGFECTWNLMRGAQELHDVFARIRLSAAEFRARAFTRLEALKFLRETGQLDERFFWVSM